MCSAGIDATTHDSERPEICMAKAFSSLINDIISRAIATLTFVIKQHNGNVCCQCDKLVSIEIFTHTRRRNTTYWLKNA